MYKKLRYLNTDIHLYEQEPNEYPRLLQHDSINKLSLIRDEKGKKPKCIINCSYFKNPYVSGRNQGDLKNACYHDSENGMYCDLIFFEDGTHKVGKFNNWDYRGSNVLAGLSPATIIIKDGVDCELISTLIENVNKITNKNPQTAVAVLNDNKIVYIVSEGRNSNDTGITGVELRKFVREQFPNVKTLCQLDGGGSSEMIVNGEVKNYLSDGHERVMFNGLAFIQKKDEFGYEEVEIEIEQPIEEEVEPLTCPFRKLKVTQYDNGEYSHKGSDAWDITDGVLGSKAPYYAPVDLVCKAVNKTYAFTWWESVNKVKFADGSIDYVTLMFGHDDNINATVGMKIAKGTQIGNMGTGGNATGVHCHIEVGKGKYKGNWYPNDYGVYCLYNSMKFYDAFFMDGVEIIECKYSNYFKYLQPKVDEKELLKAEIKELKETVASFTNQIVDYAKQVQAKEIEIVKLENKLTDIKKILEA